jgi:hypothetical protein
MISTIEEKQKNLENHSLYSKLKSSENLKIFMQYHVFAVWDFMSLLKSLQRQITCTSHPWQESSYEPKLVRLINEIVLGEESDLDLAGNPSSHYALYLKAMEEVGADTRPILHFTKTGSMENLPRPIIEMVHFHLNVAESAAVHEVAASFFFGREKLIPSIFTATLNVLEKEQLNCPTLIYYLKRHIEVDGDEHGPMALECLKTLTDSSNKKEEAERMALKSLQMREQLWDFISARLT